MTPFTIGAVESYYGRPLSHDERVDLVRWLGRHGYNAYAYGPKDDPYHRERWREPYPPERIAELRDLVDIGRDGGIEVGLMLSPGLDWHEGDEQALANKMRSLAETGAQGFAVAWDDVPGTGPEVGRMHGRAIADAMREVHPEARWMAVPVDYATPHATSYLKAFAAEVPSGVDIAWTGSSIVSPTVTAEEATSLADDLGRTIVFADNFPVNDGGMSGVLHLGPYPERDPRLRECVGGVFCNFMPGMPIASRIGLDVASRFWNDPASDRERSWRDVIAEWDGLEPLARACRSWLTSPGPDPELLEWPPERLLEFLIAGCRKDLDPALEREVEPWLDQWEREGMALQVGLLALAHPDPKPPGLAFATAVFWEQARRGPKQVFGMRFGMYPVTTRNGDDLVLAPGAVVRGENLTDVICARATAG